MDYVEDSRRAESVLWFLLLGGFLLQGLGGFFWVIAMQDASDGMLLVGVILLAVGSVGFAIGCIGYGVQLGLRVARGRGA